MENGSHNLLEHARTIWMGIVYPESKEVLEEYRKQQEAWKSMERNPDSPFFKSKTMLLSQETIGWVTDALKLEEDNFKTKQKEMILAVLKKVQARSEEWVKQIREHHSAGKYFSKMQRND